MALLVPNNGEGDALQYYVNKATPENLILKLFTSNTTPGETDTAATYTEATGNGYAAITLAGATWGGPSEGAPSSIAYPEQTFTFTGRSGMFTAISWFAPRAGALRTWNGSRTARITSKTTGTKSRSHQRSLVIKLYETILSRRPLS
jgi:hypothetical protein